MTPPCLIPASDWSPLSAAVRERVIDFAHLRGALPTCLYLNVRADLPEQPDQVARLTAWLGAQGVRYRISRGHILENELRLIP